MITWVKSRATLAQAFRCIALHTHTRRQLSVSRKFFCELTARRKATQTITRSETLCTTSSQSYARQVHRTGYVIVPVGGASVGNQKRKDNRQVAKRVRLPLATYESQTSDNDMM